MAVVKDFSKDDYGVNVWFDTSTENVKVSPRPKLAPSEPFKRHTIRLHVHRHTEGGVKVEDSVNMSLPEALQLRDEINAAIKEIAGV